MEADDYVVVIGSSGLDIKGRSDQSIVPGISNPGVVRNTVGGVARNIAENLARLEIPTVLLSAVGLDVPGKRVLNACLKAEIDCQYIQRLRGQRTGAYLAILDANNDLKYAISDFTIMDKVDEAYIHEHETLLAEAALIVIDASLTDSALHTIFEIAREYQVHVAADPTSPVLASRLCPYLSDLYLVVPNAAETKTLCGLPHPATDRESALEVARSLVGMGVEIAVVTLGDQGLAYADSSGSGFIKAVHTNVIDTTGAGDAFCGAAIFGLLNNVPVDEAMRLGVTAASLTLESRRTVLPTLSQELLYSKLMV